MKSLLNVSLFVGALALLGMSTSAFANGYVCKKRGSSVCAFNVSTGQCVKTFKNSDYSNPMFACKKAFGGGVSSNYNPGNYYCRNFGSRVCAVDSRTGQCTHNWSRKDFKDPMFSCLKHLGHGPAKVDWSNYTCRITPSTVCAQNLQTGQCTRHWKKSDYQDPMRECHRLVGN